MPKPKDLNEKVDGLNSILSARQVEYIRNALGLLVIDLEQHRDLKRCYSYNGNWDAEEFRSVTELYRLCDIAMVRREDTADA